MNYCLQKDLEKDRTEKINTGMKVLINQDYSSNFQTLTVMIFLLV